MARKRKKRPIKLTNKFEIFFFKYKYLYVSILLFSNFYPVRYIVSVSDNNSLILYSILFSVVIILPITLFLIPTYHQVYTKNKVWGVALMFVIILALPLSKTLLYLNGIIGKHEKIMINVVVIKTCKYQYKRHYRYTAVLNMGEYGERHFRISEAMYKKMESGNTFRQTWWKGSLGIIYWKL